MTTPSPATPPTYGPATFADLAPVARLSRLGFGVPRDLFDRYVDLFGPGTIRLLHDDASGPAAPIACAAHWPMDQWFGGRPVPAQGIAMVAVDPARRGGGHGSAIMRAAMAEGRAAGAALSVLCPSTLPFYRRLGFGRGGVDCRWSAPPAAFADLPPPEADDGDAPLRPADPLDATPLAALRRPLLAASNGLPERTEALWSLALCPDGDPPDLYRGEGGYVALTPLKDRRVTVADLCLANPGAARRVADLLAGFRAQADRVVWSGGPDDPLALLAGDGVTLDRRDEWLVRILDVRRALEGRGYPADLRISATFELNDSLIFDNCGCFHLEVAHGLGRVANSGQVAEPPARLGIAAFASLFTGHASARTLSRAGLLHGEEKMIERLGRVFCGAPSWMPDRF